MTNQNMPSHLDEAQIMRSLERRIKRWRIGRVVVLLLAVLFLSMLVITERKLTTNLNDMRSKRWFVPADEQVVTGRDLARALEQETTWILVQSTCEVRLLLLY